MNVKPTKPPEDNSDPMVIVAIQIAHELLMEDIHTVNDLRSIWRAFGRWECASIPAIECLK